MSRSKKILKLRNAILEFRGRFDEKTKKWIQPPNPSRVNGIANWLTISFDEAIPKIKSFQSVIEFNQWLGSL